MVFVQVLQALGKLLVDILIDTSTYCTYLLIALIEVVSAILIAPEGADRRFN